MSLTPEQVDARRGKLTASAIGVLMGGGKSKIMKLWQELIGDPSYVRDDLSGVWAVTLGSFTESLHLDWLEKKNGWKIDRRGEVVVHPQVAWAACTLDGFEMTSGRPVEVKHVGGREAYDIIVARYYAQCQWQLEVTRTRECIFSVIEGANAPRYKTIGLDQHYTNEMWDRARRFMECVRNLTPPV